MNGAAPGAGRWLDPLRALVGEVGTPADGERWVARLDAAARRRRLASGGARPLRFVGSCEAPPAYEMHIFETGEVPTRLAGDGAWHDWYNGLVWLAFPCTKARLNALQAHAIAAGGVRGVRGALRDAATLFDENGAIVVASGDAPVRALRAFDWHSLFVAQRAAFGRDLQVIAFGHALLQKLQAPFKAICAHAWVLDRPRDPASGRPIDPAACRAADTPAWRALDAAVAASLSADALREARTCFAPLPVLGVPGWCDANEAPAFYNDPRVFRPGRGREGSQRISGETKRCTSWSPAAPDSSDNS